MLYSYTSAFQRTPTDVYLNLLNQLWFHFPLSRNKLFRLHAIPANFVPYNVAPSPERLWYIFSVDICILSTP